MRNPHSFDEFYRTTAVGMLRFAHAVTEDPVEAQDVVQEAYTRAWRQWRTVADHPAPAAWVRLVVARLATDRWRRIFGLRAALARSGPPQSARPPSEDAVLLVNALRQLPPPTTTPTGRSLPSKPGAGRSSPGARGPVGPPDRYDAADRWDGVRGSRP